MIKTHTFTVDGLQYTTATFPAAEGIVLAARLAKLLVGPLMLLLDADLDDEGEASETDDGKLTGPVKRIVEMARSGALDVPAFLRDVDPHELASLAQALLVRTECEDCNATGQRGPMSAHFGSHFAGRYGHLLKVLVEVGQLGFTGP